MRRNETQPPGSERIRKITGPVGIGLTLAASFWDGPGAGIAGGLNAVLEYRTNGVLFKKK